MATINSNGIGGGLSDLGLSWSGGIAPVDGDKVNIVLGDTITMNSTGLQWGDDTTTGINIKSGGILKASRSVSSVLRCNGSLIVEAGGELDTGKTGDVIPTGVSCTINLNYSASILNDKYSLTIINAGKWFSMGETMTRNTLLNGGLSAGATTAVLDDITGWRVGDEIVFSSTTDNRRHVDKVTILTIPSANTVTFASLTYVHADNCEVGNFSSNVTYRSHTAGASKQGYIIWDIGTVLGNSTIEYTSFSYLGNTNPAISISRGAYALTGQLIFNHNSVSEAQSTSVGIRSTAGSPESTITDLASYHPNATNASGSDIQTYGGCYKLTITNSVFYFRNNGPHIASGSSQGGAGITFTNCKFLGASACMAGGGFTFAFNNCEIYNQNTAFSPGFSDTFRVNSCNVGANGIGTRTGYVLVSTGFGKSADVIFTDCNIVYSSAISGAQYDALNNWKVTIANKNLDPTLQEIYTNSGNFFRDNSTFKTGSASLRYDALVGATKRSAQEFFIFAPTDKPIAVSGFLRKNSSYGSSTRPYAELSGLGITVSTYTMTDVDDTWEQFTVSGVQSTGTDGMLTLKIYFQSEVGGGSAWVDGVSAPTPVSVSSGDFGYWAKGQPSDIITSNFTSPIDFWNTLKSDATLSGSMGEEIKNIKNDTSLIPAIL